VELDLDGNSSILQRALVCRRQFAFVVTSGISSHGGRGDERERWCFGRFEYCLWPETPR